jgi:hypothetical protein
MVAMTLSLLASVAMIPAPPFTALVQVPVPAKPTAEPFTVPIVRPGFEWNEAIVSWNVQNPDNAKLKVEVEVRGNRYVLADWTGDMAKGPRASVPNQKNEDGEVQTDLLHLNKPADSLTLRIHLQQPWPGTEPILKLLTISFSNIESKPESEDGPLKIGKILEPPQKGQGPYELGKLQYRPERASAAFATWFKKVKDAQYCSPTSVSMVLGYWAQKLNRPELAVDVPDIVTGVFDEKYPGTGNWPFNTALMGSYSGICAYVTRLGKIQDLEKLIDADVPVVCSVALNLLLGNGKPPGGDGHLVVLVGFDKDGDPVFNDPAKADQVRRTYKRENFRKAWSNAHRTVYICHPERYLLPALSENSVLSKEGGQG